MSKIDRELAEEVERLLRFICFKVRVNGREALKDYPITPAQFDVLQRLYFDGPQTMTKLSQTLGVAKSTMTGLVMRLERDGFLKKQPSKDDRRVILVDITEKGVEVIKSVIKKRVDYVEELLNHLRADAVKTTFKVLKNLDETIRNL